MKTRTPVCLSPAVTVLLGVLLCLLPACLVLAIQPTPLNELFSGWLKAPALFLLNLWPVAALLLLVFFLAGNLFYGAAAANLLWGFFSCVNLVKLEARNDPFVPSDFTLFFEAAKAVGAYQMNLHLDLLLLLLVFTAGLVLLGRMVKTPPLPLPKRILGLLLTAGLFLVSLPTLYMDNDLYHSFPGPNRANVPAVFRQLGFPYCFLHNINLYSVDKPETFSLAEAETYEETYRKPGLTPDQPPHIVMIMGEAFTDLPNSSTFAYHEGDNPIAPFNRLAARKDTIAGHMVVSNAGAGTANTEFDVLTAMMTNRLGEGATSAFRVLKRNTPSVPRALAQAGYQTLFLHPGNDWFYNRQGVYPLLGVSDLVFSEAFQGAERKGKWITDAAFLDVLLEEVNARAPAGPLFTYGVTIQNHQAYTYEKYGTQPEPPKSNRSLTPEETESLSVYFQGLRDTSAMLDELTACLDDQEDPYLLVFFGDHQPSLAGLEKTVWELPDDPTEARTQPYTVPFLFWANRAYWENQNLVQQGRSIGLENGQTLSSQYLGALTCRLAGFQGLDGYLDYMAGLYRELPVDSVYGNRTADGWTDALPETLQEKETLRQNWQYYRLKYQDVS